MVFYNYCFACVRVCLILSHVYNILPGLAQITNFHDRLRHHIDPSTGESVAEAHRLWVLPLHSSVTAVEQRKVFDLPQPGMRKVILSTNIAESSITVKDIKYGQRCIFVSCSGGFTGI